MMTGCILSEEVAQGNVSWDDMVTISHNAWAQNPLFADSSLMWIEVGKQVSLQDLYHGLVISSGNDASVAIAEHIAGSEEAFAGLMNQYAVELGMTSSHFANSHGLPDSNHYTTARDMAILARAVIYDHPEDYAVYAIRRYEYNGIPQKNRNELLGEDGVDGVKTGRTQEAGYSLVSSALRDGMRLISVVMGTSSSNERKVQSRKLLGYGFRFHETRKLFTANQVLRNAKVWGGLSTEIALGLSEDLFLTLPRGEFDELDDMSTIDTVISAPLNYGDRLGSLVLQHNDEVVVERPLVALDEVGKAGIFARLWDRVVLFFMQLLGML